jgi:beta-carotene hydroxylase
MPPSRFFRPRPLASGLYLAYALLLALGPGFVSLALLDSNASRWLVVPACALLTGLGGYGFQMLAATAHEGFHFTLHRRPAVSACLGIVLSSLVPGFIAAGFAPLHWSHHRNTNRPNDPDCRLFEPHRTLLRRLLRAHLSAIGSYRGTALSMLLGRPVAFSALNGLRAQTLARLCVANCVWHLVLMSTLMAACFVAPRVALHVFVLPFLVMVMISGLNPYQEHAATGDQPGTNARTRSSMVLTVLMCGANYHLEHHLYPRVPCWRLPALHRWLRRTPWYHTQRAVHVRTFFAGFSPRLISSRAQYHPPDAGSA